MTAGHDPLENLGVWGQIRLERTRDLQVVETESHVGNASWLFKALVPVVVARLGLGQRGGIAAAIPGRQTFVHPWSGQGKLVMPGFDPQADVAVLALHARWGVRRHEFDRGDSPTVNPDHALEGI